MLNVAKMPPLPTTTAVPVNPATKGSRQKKRIRLTVSGGVRGGVTAPSLTVSKCENFDLFVQWNMTL